MASSAGAAPPLRLRVTLWEARGDGVRRDSPARCIRCVFTGGTAASVAELAAAVGEQWAATFGVGAFRVKVLRDEQGYALPPTAQCRALLRDGDAVSVEGDEREAQAATKDVAVGTTQVRRGVQRDLAHFCGLWLHYVGLNRRLYCLPLPSLRDQDPDMWLPKTSKPKSAGLPVARRA